MLFREAQDSPWLNIFLISGGVAVLAAVFILFFVKNEVDDHKRSVFRRLFATLIVCGLACWVGMALALHQQRAQNEADLSRQLLAEYDVTSATSSGSFYNVVSGSKPSGGANVVFTRDGKDTPVFVQVVKRDGNDVMLAFHVLGDDSLYPQTK